MPEEPVLITAAAVRDIIDAIRYPISQLEELWDLSSTPEEWRLYESVVRDARPRADIALRHLSA